MKPGAAILLLGLLAALAPAGEPVHEALPSWREPASWRIAGADPAALEVDGVEGWLRLRFDAEPGRSADLLLARPCTVPAWAGDLAFRGVTSLEPSAFGLGVLMQDADGRRFTLRTKQPYRNAYHGDLDVVNTGQERGRLRRFSVPALARPDARPSLEHVVQGPPGAVPRPPLAILGLTLRGERQAHHRHGAPSELYLQGFAFSALTPASARLAWQLDGREGYGESDGRPCLRLGDLGLDPGRYRVDWELRHRFDGPSEAAGAATADLPAAGQTRPLPLVLADPVVDLPLHAGGAAWLRLHVRLTTSRGTGAEERDLRFDRLDGTGGAAATPVSSSRRLAIIPAQGSRIASGDGPWRVRVEVGAPAPGDPPATCHLRIATANLGTVLAERDLAPAWTGDAPWTEELDLDACGHDALRLELTLRTATGVAERRGELVGRTRPPAAPAPVPAGVPSAGDVLAGRVPLMQLSPMIHSGTRGRTDRNRLDFLLPAIAQAAATTRQIEHAIPWSRLEPLPGVYDWEECDAFLAAAAAQGVQVLLWPTLSDWPEWLPAGYATQRDGRVFYDFAYHFHGLRPDLAGAPELRAAVERLFRACATRYRGHPALAGYFLLNELPSDAPFMGWREGFDDRTATSFRAAMAAATPDLAALARRWGVRLERWEEVGAPPLDAPPGWWRDWLRHRLGTHERMLAGVIAAVRAIDAHRLVLLYGDFAGTELTPDRLRSLGVALANGGSHDAIHPFAYAQAGLAGMVQRTEDHWPGRWAGYFPTVLDASLFAMSFGGGRAMNCKSYLFTWLPDQPEPLPLASLRGGTCAFDRYERFLPLWEELRRTEAWPQEVRTLLDADGFLADARSTYRGGYWNAWATLSCYQAHVPFAAGDAASATGGRLVLLLKDHLEYLPAATIDRLRRHVEAGGRIAMLASAGRHVLDATGADAEDWALLRGFGFQPPSGERRSGTRLVPAGGWVGGTIALRDPWPSRPGDGTAVVARYAGADALPAISERACGLGRVAVVWADTVIPPGETAGAHSLVRDLASWAGIAIPFDADTPHLWLNLLRQQDGDTTYLLVHQGEWQGRPGAPVAGRVRCPWLAPGPWSVRELVTGSIAAKRDAAELATAGLPIELPRRGVAVLRFTRPRTTGGGP